jgi:hypothetical protein
VNAESQSTIAGFAKKFFTPETSPARILSAANGSTKSITRAAFLILCRSFFRANDYRRATVMVDRALYVDGGSAGFEVPRSSCFLASM